MEIGLPIFLIALAILVPIFGADTRDGRDWQTPPTNTGRWR
ncbi:MAG TPA: hypothetical protein VN193_11790 [Candidatus Angelobacter sp.]|jgi:hypothetical protein|nr:hypothetical protein [Candidatus Angelobacter sp.]